ncbi:DUF742 domain-containing protein [Antrihabitans cavernicola]|uniref:DUF742 domain-containing protein n=1 Tax=Antrihabitans cavernicola TaxID=2495913 RepID=A0A5A7SHP5_9NOCA|nr:DUF742 domain-containing protein [Spelaeibacter cavernicola]KAA0023731.1 DUF742 domain-containing protein [Spelaeibacter cavernicola]
MAAEKKFVKSKSAGLVRPYSLTAGRTKPSVDLPMEAAIEALPHAEHVDWPQGDRRTEIVAICATLPSVAEVSAHLALPIGVTRVLVSDLVTDGYLRVHATLADTSTVSERRELIERVLAGLRSI